MSRTVKDLKSHKGLGRFGFKKPKRKLRPFIHDANKVIGKNEVLQIQPDNDIKQDDFDKKKHWFNAKWVQSIRRQLRFSRDYEKSQARSRIKQFDKKNFKEN